MKPPIIADSSGIVSLVLPQDSNNRRALLVRNDLLKEKQQMIIPSEVLAETINVLGRKIQHEKVVLIARELLAIRQFLIVGTTEEQRSAALKIFSRQPESVSFTDCAVMATADRFETKKIFGFDEAFHKNGYIRLGLDKVEN